MLWLALTALACTVLSLTAAQTAQADTGQVLYAPNPTTNANDLDSYEDAIRLSHSGSANGTILATFERNAGNSTNPPPGWLIYQSTNDGASFSQLSEVSPAVHPDWTFTVQPNLMEMSAPAGGYPAGTLLLATGLMPNPITQTELQLYRSTDHGASWSYVSDIATGGPGGSGVWEPFLTQLSNGEIVAYFSHEGVSGHGQIVSEEVSTDGGASWGTETPIWESPTLSDRPGMASVALMGNGQYIMSIEDCGTSTAPGDDCQVHVKTSTDGLTWGSGASDMGTAAIAALDGHGLHGNPFISWSPAGGPDGEVILSGQAVTVARNDNTNAGDFGQTLFVNYDYGAGSWYELTAPIPWASGGYQSGYRNATLPSVDGTSLLYLTSTYSGGGQRNNVVYDTANAGVLPYTDEFLGTATDSGWQTFGGSWAVNNGEYSDNGSGAGDKSVAGSTGWADYTMQGDVRLNAAGNAGLLLRVSNPASGLDSHDGYFVGINSGDGTAFLGREQYNWTLLSGGHAVPGGVQVGSWYHITVRAVGCTFTVSVLPVGSSGAPVSFGYTDSGCTLTSGEIGVRDDGVATSWRNITVSPTSGTSSTPAAYLAPFASGTATGWTNYGGTWDDNAPFQTLDNTSGGAGDKSVENAVTGTDYTVQGNVRINTASGSGASTGLLIRASNPGVGTDTLDGYYIGIAPPTGTMFIGREQDSWTLLATSAAIPNGGVITGDWYHLTVRVTGCTITASAQRFGTYDQTDLTTNDCAISSGAIGVRTFDATASWAVVTATSG